MIVVQFVMSMRLGNKEYPGGCDIGFVAGHDSDQPFAIIVALHNSSRPGASNPKLNREIVSVFDKFQQLVMIFCNRTDLVVFLGQHSLNVFVLYVIAIDLKYIYFF